MAYGRLHPVFTAAKVPLGVEKGDIASCEFDLVLVQYRSLGACFLRRTCRVTFSGGFVMRVYEILQSKGNTVFQISSDATLAYAVERLVKCNCGSLLVSEADSILGIITERDILKAIESEKRDLSNLLVCDFMTRKLITGHPSDDVGDIMGKMTTHRVRHLPILDNGRLAGMISIGDVVKAQFDLLAVENHYLKVYIQG